MIRDSLVPDFVTQLPREQPAHSKHIDRGAHGAITETVLALTKLARPMMDRNFYQPITRSFDQRRNKPMHAFEWNKRADAFSSHRLQGAAGIADTIFREATADEISNPTR